jgi:hypothetical protein
MEAFSCMGTSYRDVKILCSFDYPYLYDMLIFFPCFVSLPSTNIYKNDISVHN